jgi:hypothetical protein
MPGFGVARPDAVASWLARVAASSCVALFLQPALPAVEISPRVANQANGHTYVLLEAAAWSDSEAEALSLGGHLVTINDEEENQFVVERFSWYGRFPRTLWIGYTDQEAEGVWVWVGDDSTFTRWTPGEPNNLDGTEHWGHIWPPEDPRFPNWNDVPDAVDSFPLYGVVEIPRANWAFYFGPAPTMEDVDAGEGDPLSITMQNAAPVLGFQFGAHRTLGTNIWNFASNMGTSASQLVQCGIVDDIAIFHCTRLIPGQGCADAAVLLGNKAIAGDAVRDLRRGAAISSFVNADFFAFDLAPNVGGPGFTVAYATDSDGIPPIGLIPPGTNEIILVRFGPPTVFSRQLPGDCNQDRVLDISDAVCVFRTLFTGDPTGFPCGDGTGGHPANKGLLDWDQDGAAVNISDGIALLEYYFRGGPPHRLAVVGAEDSGCVTIAGCPDACGGSA